MNEELEKVIKLYHKAVADLFPRVADFLGVELPITNREWTGIEAEQRGITDDGIKYFMHGYGIIMDSGDVVVDFDLGEKGEIDGIDPWRLWSFIDDNDIDTKIKSETELKALVKEAEEHRELIDSGYILYYLCK